MIPLKRRYTKRSKSSRIVRQPDDGCSTRSGPAGAVGRKLPVVSFFFKNMMETGAPCQDNQIKLPKTPYVPEPGLSSAARFLPVDAADPRNADGAHSTRLSPRATCAQSAATPVFPSLAGNSREADLLLLRSRPGPCPDPSGESLSNRFSLFFWTAGVGSGRGGRKMAKKGLGSAGISQG